MKPRIPGLKTAVVHEVKQRFHAFIIHNSHKIQKFESDYKANKVSNNSVQNKIPKKKNRNRKYSSAS